MKMFTAQVEMIEFQGLNEFFYAVTRNIQNIANNKRVA
ncbi:hypothetical protein CLCAR_3655 [Clostridium carboxidivorans P7]|nr:hypothetical protein CLCAR_3655 [Clostridium carboxidivorans P7]